MEMADEAVRLVLGGDGDAPYARVEGVRERKINDARFTAKGDKNRMLSWPEGGGHRLGC